jgi:hypothetical protein
MAQSVGGRSRGAGTSKLTPNTAMVASAAKVEALKGLVFTEFLEMVEARWSAEMVDDIIDGCTLASKGA